MLAELKRVFRAEFRVVAAAALGDVVKQAGEHQQFLLRHLGDDLAAQGKFMAELRHREAAQVAHHEHGVLVHGIDMEKIVLHLADDVVEHRQVGGQHTVAVHAAQLVGDAHGLADQFHEQAATGEIVAKLHVDEVAVGADETNGVGAHALELGVLRHEQEDFQQGKGMVLEDLRVARLEEALA